MGLLFDTLRAHAHNRPAHVALVSAAGAIDYATLERRIAATGKVLAALGVARGERVAFLGYNEPEVVELLVACAERGAILLPLNFRLASAEHQGILAHAGAGLLIVGSDFAEQAARLEDVPVLGLEELRQRVAARLALAADAAGKEPRDAGAGAVGADDIGADDIAADDIGADDETPCLLVYTSGTTGAPKGAVHTPAALFANARAAWAAHEMVASDHVLTMLPMFHVGGLCIQTLPALLLGATVTLHARVDPSAWLHDVQTLRPTLSLVVPPVMKALIEHPGFSTADLSSLRLLMAGSSVVPVSLIEAFHARGVPVGQVYGGTETGPVSIVLGRADARRKVGAVGWPALDVEVSLRDEAGAPVEDGAVGEIWLRAPNLARGYWRDAGHPAFAGGWFRTGDLGRRDQDGCYFVVGRSKDMIVSGGENIYPAEIENLLDEHPAIVESAVIGVPHERWGEVPVAAVVLTEPGAVADPEELIAYLAERLARYKLPRRVEFMERLPKSALGKVQKGMLRDELR